MQDLFQNGLKAITSFVSLVLVSISSLIGLGNEIPQSSPTPTIEIVASQNPIPSQTPVIEISSDPTPTLMPSKSPTSSPLPSPTVIDDLRMERVILHPDKFMPPDKYILMSGMDSSKMKINKGNNIYKAYVSYKRTGDIILEDVSIKIIFDGITKKEYKKNIDGKSDQHQDIEVDLHNSELGVHKVEVQINPDKLIPESSYENNTIVLEYEVVP